MKRIPLIIITLLLILMSACARDSGGSDEPTPAPNGIEETTPTPDGDTDEPVKEPSFVFTFADTSLEDNTRYAVRFAELVSELSDGDWRVDIRYVEETDKSFDYIGNADLALISEYKFDEAAPEELTELCRFSGNIIVIRAGLWGGLSPEDQSSVLQCALEVAFEFGAFEDYTG